MRHVLSPAPRRLQEVTWEDMEMWSLPSGLPGGSLSPCWDGGDTKGCGRYYSSWKGIFPPCVPSQGRLSPLSLMVQDAKMTCLAAAATLLLSLYSWACFVVSLEASLK